MKYRTCMMTTVVLCIMCFSFTVVTELSYAESFQAGINFTVGLPRGEFDSNVKREGYGGRIEGLFAPDTFPFGIGIELGYMNYGTEKRTEPLSTTIPDLKVRVKNSYNIMTGNIVLRFAPWRGSITPYIDGLVGFKYLFTDTEIKENSFFGKEIASSKSYDDIALGYGAGAGVMFPLFSFGSGDEYSVDPTLYLDMKVRYMHGGEAKYLKKGSIKRIDGHVSYDEITSETDMMLYHIGVTVGF